MLPFMKPRRVTSLLIAKHDPETGIGNAEPEQEEKEGLLMAAEHLISAIHSKDAKAVASALRAAFDMADSEPHKEGEHF